MANKARPMGPNTIGLTVDLGETLDDAPVFAEQYAVVKGHQAVVPLIIANTGTVSGAVDLGVRRAVGLSLPASFEGTSLTFQASYDGATYVPLYDRFGAAVAVVAAASRRVVLNPADFYGIRYLKVVSNNAVGADRTLRVIAEG